MRSEISALFFKPTGGAVKVHIKRVQGAESDAEFWGRALCRIEDRIRETLGVDQIPAGFKWAQWNHKGDILGRWHFSDLPGLYTHTGQRYSMDRYTSANPFSYRDFGGPDGWTEKHVIEVLRPHLTGGV